MHCFMVLTCLAFAVTAETVQGRVPEYMHVVTPTSVAEPESYRTAAFSAYYRRVKTRLEQFPGRSLKRDDVPGAQRALQPLRLAVAV